MGMQRRSLAIVAAALLACAAAVPAMAQGYPRKPIRFVVGFSAGNSIDSVARIIGQHLSAKFGQPVLVDNKTGANGMLAATEVARSPPDGYTVLISNSSTITVNPLLYQKMGYEPKKDFVPVALMVSVPFILTVNPQKGPIGTVPTLQGMLDLARAKPGAYSYGSAGMGNLTQLGFELLNGMAGVDMTHVAYRGSAPAQVPLPAAGGGGWGWWLWGGGGPALGRWLWWAGRGAPRSTPRRRSRRARPGNCARWP